MTIKEVKEFLRNIQPFQELDDATMNNIAGGVLVEFYPKDASMLLLPPNDFLRIIRKGRVKVLITSAVNEPARFDFRGKGDSFGYLRDRVGSKIHVSAIEDTTCYLISKEILYRILEAHPIISDFFKGGGKAETFPGINL